MRKKCTIALIATILILNSFFYHTAAVTDVPGEQVILPIIMYHEVKHQHLGKDVISPYDFESDLIYLQKHHYTAITISDLLDYMHEGAALPENPIILSFDDGYLSNYKYVLPLLKKYNMKIVLSIIVKNTDDFSRIPDDNIEYSHVTWRQLNEMLDSGLVEVQNHSYNMHAIKKGWYGCIRRNGEPLGKYQEILKKDILKAQNKINMMTGRQPAAFSYPFGSYCDDTDVLLRKLGFQVTLSCRYGLNKISRAKPDGLFRLKRLCRSHNQNLDSLLTEAYKTIKKSPP